MSAKDKIADLQENGYCLLKAHLPKGAIEACREAFWPTLIAYLKTNEHQPNRGPNRHFLPMPFEPPCFAPEFFFDAEVLSIVRGAMDARVVADQWGCDVPVRGSEYQGVHVDYRRPLFEEMADLPLPPYMLVVSFGLVPITAAHGPIQIAPGTQRMPRDAAMRAVECGQIELHSAPLEVGDVLIRHPWTLHRGTPNTTEMPRAMATVRYVRRWYADASREVNAIPNAVWQSLTPEQQEVMRFPITKSNEQGD
jgi:ectoine hydroxylase-related dioxygenase (phytanoyl-CoA dioxygenase family)